MGTTLIAIQTLTQLLTQAQGYAALISKARSENREVSPAELDTLAAADDAAKARLQALIDDAKAKGK
jgi:hypothetical protein